MNSQTSARLWRILRHSLLLLLVLAQNALAEPVAKTVRLSLINTSGAETLEAMVVKGGHWTDKVRMGHIAVLVEHPQGRFLFDTGLGRKVDRQFHNDMPWYLKPLFAYTKVTPARDQLDAAGISIDRVILSHSHWDHVSGLVDFPTAQVWITPAELAYDQTAVPPAVMPSQIVDQGIHWHPFNWTQHSYRGYDRSFDVFGDGSVVLVPQEGHTPGGVGMFVYTGSGREFFFIGDTVWNLKGIQHEMPKFWVASKLVDNNPEQVKRDIARIAELQRQDPQLIVIPAHDRQAQDAWGYFPKWVD